MRGVEGYVEGIVGGECSKRNEIEGQRGEPSLPPGVLGGKGGLGLLAQGGRRAETVTGGNARLRQQ